MESLRNIKTYIKTKLSFLFNSKRLLAIKKEYLYSFFKKKIYAVVQQMVLIFV